MRRRASEVVMISFDRLITLDSLYRSQWCFKIEIFLLGINFDTDLIDASNLKALKLFGDDPKISSCAIIHASLTILLPHRRAVV